MLQTNDTRLIHSSQCVQITLPAAATLQFGNIASVHTPPVVVKVPSSQLQLSTQANVSIVLYGLWPDCCRSPDSVATGYLCSPQAQHDRHPSLSPVSTKLLVTHYVSAFEFCLRLASSVHNYSSCHSVYTLPVQ